MIVDLLKAAAKTVANVVSKNSVNPLSRCFELGPNSIKGYSELGNIEYAVDIPEIINRILVDSDAFLAVVSSLGSGAELSLTQNEDRIAWKSGTAKGYLSLVQVDNQIPSIDYIDTPWTPPTIFPDALDLAASACEAVTVSVGLYGVVLQPDNSMLRIASSNGFSLAAAWVPLDGYPTQETVTLRPPVPTIVSHLLHAATNPQMNITSNGLFILGDNLIAQLPLSSPLSFDLDSIIAPYVNAEHVAKINSSAIKRYIDRSRRLVDKGSTFLITVRVIDGHIVLEQTSAAAGSEQYFIAEGLTDIGDKQYASVTLSGKLMATSLGHVKEVVLDYLDQNTLVFQGEEPKFKHIIGGSSKGNF